MPRAARFCENIAVFCAQLMNPPPMNIAKYIDHTLLRYDLKTEDIRALCEEAITYGFANVCVPPYFVKESFKILETKPSGVCSVVGFPYGNHLTPVKVDELKRALDDGADEVDVVINISALKSNDWSYVANDIEACTRAALLKGKIVKIILETAILSREEAERLCAIAIESGASFVKTSTGVNAGGATPQAVSMLKSIVGSQTKIKASGGIKTLADAMTMIEAGADRIGTSSGVSIISKKK